ncbi:MAG TPA: class I SAM-dependent methyltransferase [Polyangiaceae bacterium]|nr:class I SAM-dependent methyltransferase [Polyangiaceae bacterium]
MSKDIDLERSYQNPFIGYGYDALSWLVYSPLGGRSALREQALNLVDPKAGERVLELGCGTGGITSRLLRRGALVTAVDWSEPMLKIAKQRAPGVSFVKSELTEYQPQAEFDVVLLAFVLHELAPQERCKALAIAASAVAMSGRVAVVDHAAPESGLIARSMFRFVHAFEPPSVSEWAKSTFEPELLAAGLRPYRSSMLAQGTARAVLARKPG